MARILLVDDYDPFRRAFSIILSDAGHSVVSVDDGDKAQEWLELSETGGDRVDLVITDNMMTRVCGPALLAWIREKFPDMPVILFSASSVTPNTDRTNLVELCGELGATFILKDANLIDELLKTVDKILTKTAMRS